MPLTSVAGGSWNDGNWFASAGFCGPGSSRLVRLLPLILPSAGESGLPNEAADAAADTPSAAAEAAAPNRTSRRDRLLIGCLTDPYLGDSQFCDPPFPGHFEGLAVNYECNIRFAAAYEFACRPRTRVSTSAAKRARYGFSAMSPVPRSNFEEPI